MGRLPPSLLGIMTDTDPVREQGLLHAEGHIAAQWVREVRRPRGRYVVHILYVRAWAQSFGTFRIGVCKLQRAQGIGIVHLRLHAYLKG